MKKKKKMTDECKDNERLKIETHSPVFDHPSQEGMPDESDNSQFSTLNSQFLDDPDLADEEVDAFFAELQAEEHRPMYMKDWIAILDDFLRISRKDILSHAGRVTAQLAKAKADAEYDKFKERTKNELTPVEIHFIEQFEREQKLIESQVKGKE